MCIPKQLLFSEVNYLNYTKKDTILYVTITFFRKQGQIRASSGPIAVPLNQKLLVKYHIFAKLSQISHIKKKKKKKKRNFRYDSTLLDQPLLFYKFKAGTCKECTFSFATYEPSISVCFHWFKECLLVFDSFSLQSHSLTTFFLFRSQALNATKAPRYLKSDTWLIKAEGYSRWPYNAVFRFW